VIEVRHVQADSPTVVVVELQRRSTYDLARLLRSAIGAGEVSVLVDLGDLRDATSDLLTVLHRAARSLRALGGRLDVVSSQPELRRLLELTLLSQGFGVFGSRDEALRAWS
jgi:anti-anti-sigma factor